jgi:hypothetical protein
VGLPTRSDIEGWTDAIGDLSSSATAYRAAGERVEAAADAHVQQMSAPGGTVWQGDAADAARESGYADRGVVYRAADHMRNLAKIASLGAQNLSQARDRALDAISDAEGDDFRVGDDLTVTDLRRYTSREMSLYLARKAKAEEHHGYIAMRAGTLASEDAEVGAKLQAGAATLDGMAPLHWGTEQSPAQPVSDGDGEIQSYDNDNDGSYTGREIAKELDQLNDGTTRGIKEVDTEGEIFDLWEKYSQGGVPVPIPKDKLDEIYDMVKLPDGTTISVRESSNHGPTLDVGYPPGVQGPNKVHFPDAPPPPPVPQAPPPAAGGEAPIIAAPPQLPVADHPPVALPPPVAEHPLIPPGVHVPEGFDLLPPNQNPLLAPFDVSEMPTPGPTWTPPSDGPIISLPPISHDDAAKAGTATGITAVGILTWLTLIFQQN